MKRCGLEVVADMLEAVIPAGISFFVRVEEMLRIENILGFTKQPDNVMPVHLRQPRTAHQPVIMIAG